MGKTSPRLEARLYRHQRVREKVRGTPERPRLAVFRSARHVYAQLIDDTSGHTLASASSVEAEFRNSGSSGGNREGAAVVGRLIAKRALAEGIEQVVLDRGGYRYHGRVKSLADAAREVGLKF